MRIGILTFHFSCNYGGVLQTYALYQTLKFMGHDVKVVDMVPTTYKKSWKNYLTKNLDKSSIYQKLQMILYSRGLKKNFDTFRREYIQMTGRLDEHSMHTLNSQFDAFVVGSDQIWNPSQHRVPVYFLNWEPKFEGRRISYAPCCAVNRILPEAKEMLRAALSNFDFLSVRNQETYDFVKRAAGIEPQIVADPTILYDFNEFKPKAYKQPYILVYVLGKDIPGGNTKAIFNLKRLYQGCKVISIQSVYDTPQYQPWADKILYRETPADWVSWVAGATCVYTDSFHATIFSMKYRRNFVCYYAEPHRTSRFIDMKERYGIGLNIVTSAEEIDNKKMSDLSTPDTALQAMAMQREESIGFLRKSLE